MIEGAKSYETISYIQRPSELSAAVERIQGNLSGFLRMESCEFLEILHVGVEVVGTPGPSVEIS